MSAKLVKAFNNIEGLSKSIPLRMAQIEKKDAEVIDIMAKTREKMRQLRKFSKSGARDKRNKLYEEIRGMLRKASSIQHEKHTIAEKSYDEVDRHITTLDREWTRYSTKFLEKQHPNGRPGFGPKEGNTLPAMMLDMPVDPNEPRYCTCNQVSYGEMIMCDNKACKIEWFHFPCVGLTETPKGKWYCDACTTARKKK